MNRHIYLFLLFVLPFGAYGQTQKSNMPSGKPYKVPAVPTTKIVVTPLLQGRASAPNPNSIPKKATDRELDSIYHKVYNMDVPMFYEETETHRPKQQ